MGYTFFHKNHFLLSANCIRLTGNCWSEKSQWRNAWPLPKLCTKQEWVVTLTTSFPKFRQETKAEIQCGIGLYARGVWLSPHSASWLWQAHPNLGRWEGGVFLGVIPLIFWDSSQGSLDWRTARKTGKPSETCPHLTTRYPPAVCRNQRIEYKEVASGLFSSGLLKQFNRF